MLITVIYIGSSNSLFQDVVRDYEKRIKNIGRSIGLKEIIYKGIKNSNKKNAIEKKDEEILKLENVKNDLESINTNYFKVSSEIEVTKSRVKVLENIELNYGWLPEGIRESRKRYIS